MEYELMKMASCLQLTIFLQQLALRYLQHTFAPIVTIKRFCYIDF